MLQGGVIQGVTGRRPRVSLKKKSDSRIPFHAIAGI